MSELSRASGVSVATIKFYRREGLLPPGVAVSATRARYDESHVRRLRMVRALVEVARLPLSVVRDVVTAIEDHSGMHEVLGTAHTALSRPGPSRPGETPTTRALQQVDGLVRRQRWRVHAGSPSRAALARALDAYDSLGRSMPVDRLDVYAEAAHAVAAADVAGVPEDSREEAVEYAVVGTVLSEPILLALRRLAHEAVSARRFRTTRRPRD
jgi:DNA-binding transcriptional MerR regulator